MNIKKIKNKILHGTFYNIKNFLLYKQNVPNSENRSIYDINFEQVKQKQAEGDYLIDVRSPQEYKEGHIQGAINIPLYDLNENIDSVIQNKENNIIVYCKSGQRSTKAVDILEKNGYKNIFNLEGGIDAVEE